MSVLKMLQMSTRREIIAQRDEAIWDLKVAESKIAQLRAILGGELEFHNQLWDILADDKTEIK